LRGIARGEAGAAPEECAFLKFLTYFWGPIPWMIEAAVNPPARELVPGVVIGRNVEEVSLERTFAPYRFVSRQRGQR